MISFLNIILCNVLCMRSVSLLHSCVFLNLMPRLFMMLLLRRSFTKLSFVITGKGSVLPLLLHFDWPHFASGPVAELDESLFDTAALRSAGENAGWPGSFTRTVLCRPKVLSGTSQLLC